MFLIRWTSGEKKKKKETIIFVNFVVDLFVSSPPLSEEISSRGIIR